MKLPLHIAAIAACISIAVCLPQEAIGQETYFRYLEVVNKDLSENKLESLEALLDRNKDFSLHQFCARQKRLIIAVNAQHPKRIDDIKSEIEGYIQKSFRTKEPVNIATIPASSRDKACQ